MEECKSTSRELLSSLNESFNNSQLKFEIDTLMSSPEIVIFLIQIKENPHIKSILAITDEAKKSIQKICDEFSLITEFSDINTVFWVKL